MKSIAYLRFHIVTVQPSPFGSGVSDMRVKPRRKCRSTARPVHIPQIVCVTALVEYDAKPSVTQKILIEGVELFTVALMLSLDLAHACYK